MELNASSAQPSQISFVTADGRFFSERTGYTTNVLAVAVARRRPCQRWRAGEGGSV